MDCEYGDVEAVLQCLQAALVQRLPPIYTAPCCRSTVSDIKVFRNIAFGVGASCACGKIIATGETWHQCCTNFNVKVLQYEKAHPEIGEQRLKKAEK